MTIDATGGPTVRPTRPAPRPAWDDVRRLEEWAGEVRVNLVRLVGVLLFYGRHVFEYALAPPEAPVRGPYHLRVTAIAAVWAALVILVQFQLRRRSVPPWLKYVATACDLFLVTLLCMAAGGPRSPLVLLLFLVIAMAPLRLSLPLVYATTTGAVFAYLCLLAFYAWFKVGYAKYYATPELRIPRGEEAVYVLALLVAGLLAGQVVRQARRIAAGYPVTVSAGDGEGEAR
jgi:hypothetical protein